MSGAQKSTGMLRSIDRPTLIACGFILVYTLVTQGTATFIEPTYLLQQLKIAAFLGIVAAGMMMVILLGHIDLSVPWTLAASAMIATAVGGPWAIPIGLGIGLVVGLINGLGVAFLRVPSMIFTLGVNAVLRGLMVMLTGGFAPQSSATPLMKWIATAQPLSIPVGGGESFGIANSVVVWALISAAIVFMLTRTTMGRYIYATGNREAATYLSGINTKFVLIFGFVLCSMCASLAGLLVAGYTSKAFQAMGDSYLQYSGRPGALHRHRGRHHPDRVAAKRVERDADAGSRAADHLWLGDHRDAAGLWPQQHDADLIPPRQRFGVSVGFAALRRRR